MARRALRPAAECQPRGQRQQPLAPAADCRRCHFRAGDRNRRWTLYAAALLAAFLLFCLYLKWQPFLARLELPLFVLGAPLAAFLVEKLRYPAVAVILAIFLVNNARPALFENWTRPLKGPHSLWATSRDDNYFSDMGQWNNRASYLESVDRTARSGCTEVGLDISENQLEYPFQALLRERNPTGPLRAYRRDQRFGEVREGRRSTHHARCCALTASATSRRSPSIDKLARRSKSGVSYCF